MPSFFDRFSKTQDLIINEINELTDHVESEFSRIVRVFMRLAIQQMLSDVPDYFSQGQLEDNEFSGLEDKEPTITEVYLSFALQSCEMSTRDFEHGDLSEAFNLLVSASEFFGMAKGHKWGDELKGLENEYKKRVISNLAAAKRHAENRSMKKQVYDYYADNMHKFTSKDPIKIIQLTLINSVPDV